MLGGVVEHHRPFGVFVDIGYDDYRGLIQITDFVDEGRMTPDEYPPIGASIQGVVKGYTYDERKQIWMSVKPSDLSHSSSQ